MKNSHYIHRACVFWVFLVTANKPHSGSNLFCFFIVFSCRMHTSARKSTHVQCRFTLYIIYHFVPCVSRVSIFYALLALLFRWIVLFQMTGSYLQQMNSKMTENDNAVRLYYLFLYLSISTEQIPLPFCVFFFYKIVDDHVHGCDLCSLPKFSRTTRPYLFHRIKAIRASTYCAVCCSQMYLTNKNEHITMNFQFLLLLWIARIKCSLCSLFIVSLECLFHRNEFIHLN